MQETQPSKASNEPAQHEEEDAFMGDAETFSDEGRCYMMGTQFKAPEGHVVAAADLSIGAKVLDIHGIERTVTWCRKLCKTKRLLVDLWTRPFTVTGSHRKVVPGGGTIEAKELNQADEVLIGGECQQLLRVTKRAKLIEVMELEFEDDATVEVHATSILTKGSDPHQTIDNDGALKVIKEEEPKEEPGDAPSMNTNVTDNGVGYVEQVREWPDTDDEWR